MNPEQLCMGCMEDTGGAEPCPHCGRPADTAPASPLHLRPRTRLHDQYVIGRVLGHGGFGITYIGWDLNLARKLAIKEYLPHGIATRAAGDITVTAYSGFRQESFEVGLEKFLEEARVLARFQNQPGIVSVLNFFRENGTAYLVMEYLSGSTLHDYVKRKGGRIAFDWAVRIMTPVMEALREVHKAGVLHRDVSPDNIYLTNSGQVKVLDFGAARYALGQQSRNLSIILKDGFAPEEQYRTKGNQGPWTDVYAVAATIYRVVTGAVPQPALDRLELDEVKPPSAFGIEVPPQREAILMKALALRPVNRYQSMDEFMADLSASRTTAAAEPVTAEVRSTRQPPPPPPPVSGPSPSAAPPPPPPTAPPAPAPVPAQAPAPISPHASPATWIIALGAVVILLAALGLVGLRRFLAPKPAPVINTFLAQPEHIQAGETALLKWDVENAREIMLEPGRMPIPALGGKAVKPGATTTYTLRVRNAAGETTRQATITVAPPVTAQVIQPTPTAAPTEPPAASPTPSPTVRIKPHRERAIETPLVRQPSAGLASLSILVDHDHSGLFSRMYRGHSGGDRCSGLLRITNGFLIYDASNPEHRFQTRLSSIDQVQENAIRSRGAPVFHIHFINGANFNFINRSGSAAAAVAAINAALR